MCYRRMGFSQGSWKWAPEQLEDSPEMSLTKKRGGQHSVTLRSLWCLLWSEVGGELRKEPPRGRRSQGAVSLGEVSHKERGTLVSRALERPVHTRRAACRSPLCSAACRCLWSPLASLTPKLGPPAPALWRAGLSLAPVSGPTPGHNSQYIGLVATCKETHGTTFQTHTRAGVGGVVMSIAAFQTHTSRRHLG